MQESEEMLREANQLRCRVATLEAINTDLKALSWFLALALFATFFLSSCAQHKTAVQILRAQQAANYTAIHKAARPYTPAPKHPLVEAADTEAEAIRILQGAMP